MATTTRIILDFSDLSTITDAVKAIEAKRTIFTDTGAKKLKKLAKQVELRFAVPLRNELRKYPPIRDRSKPVRWKSAKQRRYVMMMASRGDISLPYTRTGRLAEGWKVSVILTMTRQNKIGIIKVMVSNDVPHQQFVTGKFGMGQSSGSLKRYVEPQQPFHQDSSWELSYKPIQEAVEDSRVFIQTSLKEWSKL